MKKYGRTLDVPPGGFPRQKRLPLPETSAGEDFEVNFEVNVELAYFSDPQYGKN